MCTLCTVATGMPEICQRGHCLQNAPSHMQNIPRSQPSKTRHSLFPKALDTSWLQLWDWALLSQSHERSWGTWVQVSKWLLYRWALLLLLFALKEDLEDPSCLPALHFLTSSTM